MIASSILADSLAMTEAGMPRAFALATAFEAHTAELNNDIRSALRKLLLGV